MGYLQGRGSNRTLPDSGKGQFFFFVYIKFIHHNVHWCVGPIYNLKNVQSSNNSMMPFLDITKKNLPSHPFSEKTKPLYNNFENRSSVKLGTHHAIFVGMTIVVCRDDGRRLSNDPHTPRDDRRMTRTHHATIVE